MAEVGRICVKKKGRERGKKCVIVDIIDENFVLITGPKMLTGVKRRRANVRHLSFMDTKVNLRRGASDEEVLKAIEEAGLKEALSGGS
jgi:large subunit ribosomal protein L14e